MLIIGSVMLITRDSVHPYFERVAVVCDAVPIVASGADVWLVAA